MRCQRYDATGLPRGGFVYRCPNAEQFELRDQYERWLRKPEGLPVPQCQLRYIGQGSRPSREWKHEFVGKEPYPRRFKWPARCIGCGYRIRRRRLLGTSLCDREVGKMNSVNVEFPQWGYHAWNGNAGLSIYADSCYWSIGSPPTWTSVPKRYGLVSTLDPLTIDPIPFRGTGTAFSKTMSAKQSAPPKPRLKILLIRASMTGISRNVRNEISSFVRQSWYSADLTELKHDVFLQGPDDGEDFGLRPLVLDHPLPFYPATTGNAT